MNILTAFVGQYFKADCDIVVVTIATLKVHKKNLQISVFADYLKTSSVTYPFYYIFGKLPKNSLTFLAVQQKVIR